MCMHIPIRIRSYNKAWTPIYAKLGSMVNIYYFNKYSLDSTINVYLIRMLRYVHSCQ